MSDESIPPAVRQQKLQILYHSPRWRIKWIVTLEWKHKFSHTYGQAFSLFWMREKSCHACLISPQCNSPNRWMCVCVCMWISWIRMNFCKKEAKIPSLIILLTTQEETIEPAFYEAGFLNGGTKSGKEKGDNTPTFIIPKKDVWGRELLLNSFWHWKSLSKSKTPVPSGYWRDVH